MVVPLLASLAVSPALHFASVPGRPLLMQHPTMNDSVIVFSFGGDLWSVPRSGGRANRLTSSLGTESEPTFSPDGRTIAFAGEYDGNLDVYTMPANGGEPKRLTYHPSGDSPRGWTPDGKNVLYVSGMLSDTDLPRLFTVSTSGGFPKALPLPSGSNGSYSGDGTKVAYDPGMIWQAAWKRYRGGQTSKIWMANLADSSVAEIPRKNSNDTYPMWVGSKVYFLSDRNGPIALYSYDTTTKQTASVVKNSGFDFKSASAGAGGIVIEQLGGLKIFNIASGKVEDVEVTIEGDFPEVRTQYKNLASSIASASISPNGARAVFEARGDIVTVPAAKGDVRNLTGSSGVADRSPAWSPDGASIAYLSDAGGEYKLIVRPANGPGEGKSYPLGQDKAFFYRPIWSPDSKKVSYTDNHHQIWILDLESGKSTKVDETPYENPTLQMNPVWSPDSKWLTYHRDLDSHMTAVFLYSLESGKATQLTDGLSDAKDPIFDLGGKYLFFTASTNTATGTGWLDLTTYRSINKTSAVYAVVLRNDLPSPLAPESDEEKATPPAAPAAPATFRIDLEGIDQRIISLPMPSLNYGSLYAGPAGSFFALEVGPLATITSTPRVTLWKFDLATKTPSPFASGVNLVDVAPNGQKMLIAAGGSISIVGTQAPPAPGQGALNIAAMSTKVDPRAEWRQMFHEILRIQRDFFYDPGLHGVDLKALAAKYEPFLDGLVTRASFNYLMEDMLGEFCIGHMNVGGGDVPVVNNVPGGLLGADFTFANGRYRFERVYNGENWNPGLRAPLTQPGVNVKAGEYILEIDGKSFTDKDDVFAALEGKADKQVKLKVGPNANGTGAREVVVVPTASDRALRVLAWREDNRRKVERLSGGKLGYMHIPDTNIGGWTNFNRYYYAQLDKLGMVVDERFNHGGQVDDFMTESMIRPLRSMWTTRYGKDTASPLATIYGPKALIVNAYAGSGGDYFPWVFRQAKAGPIIGERTWGGLVGILAFPALIDGGGVTAPNIAFYNPNGTWDVENYGTPPDIEVIMDPALWRQGRDPQLERAVAEVLKLIEKAPKSTVKKPAYPNKTKIPPQ